jgi:hypothetical protein
MDGSEDFQKCIFEKQKKGCSILYRSKVSNRKIIDRTAPCFPPTEALGIDIHYENTKIRTLPEYYSTAVQKFDSFKRRRQKRVS